MSNFFARISSQVVRILLLPVLFFAGGCTSFSHDWKKAAEISPPPGSMEGRWQGVWLSDVNHHTGELRCVVTRSEDGMYRARFHAKYNKVLSFGYTVKLKVEPQANAFHFSGDANLGWYAGGIYHYDGHADATNFFSTYSCKYDHGTFKMSRP
ncbi:MAG TPA: hypothetical protein VFB72_03135 [Verrucomicrobiae bacterium]|nr:hypothetical protein [Verrucomicrobiae bacterium]